MIYRRDLGPNSFVFAFENEGLDAVRGALYDAVTESIDGVPRYGYEKVGTAASLALGGYNYSTIKGKAYDGSVKYISFVTFTAGNYLSMEVGGRMHASGRFITDVARYDLMVPAVNPAIQIPAGRFQIYVFAHKDWLLIVPMNRTSMLTIANLTGGLGVFNTFPWPHKSSQAVPVKYIMCYTGFMSGIPDYLAGYLNGTYPIWRNSPFIYPWPDRPEFTVNIDNYVTYGDTYIVNQYGGMFRNNGMDMASYSELCPPDDIAVTLRGKVGATKLVANNTSGQEFGICGLKMSRIGTTSFLDKVTVKCDDEGQLETIAGNGREHYVIEGQGPQLNSPSAFSPAFRYLIPS